MTKYCSLIILCFYAGILLNCAPNNKKAQDDILYFQIQKNKDSFYKEKNPIEHILPQQYSLFHIAPKNILLSTNDTILFYYKTKFIVFLNQQLTKNKIYRFVLYEKRNSWNPIRVINERISKKRKGIIFPIKNLKIGKYILFLEEKYKKTELVYLNVKLAKNSINYESLPENDEQK